VKVLVCGGRSYRDRDKVFAVLDEIHAVTPIAVIVHGACCTEDNALCGADGLAEAWAVSREVPYRGYPARWRTEGGAAGPRRNERMLGLEHRPPDRIIGLVVAFPGGTGTAHMCGLAKVAGIEVRRVAP